MCHCAENRALLRAVIVGKSTAGDALAQVGANVADDVRVQARRVAASAGARLAAAKARLRR